MNRYKDCAQWIEQAEKLVVLSGAGLSTESGIPDFRSSKGLYNQNTDRGIPIEDVLSRRFFDERPEDFYTFYKEKLLHPKAKPNAGHFFLSGLEQDGKDITIITQNIDGLHKKAGSQTVLELHGSTSRVVDESGIYYSVDSIVEYPDRWQVDDKWVRPDIVLYEEALNKEVLLQSSEAIRQADCLLVMGTSLNVYPAAGLIFNFLKGKSILVNKEPTRSADFFEMVFITTISAWVNEINKHLP